MTSGASTMDRRVGMTAALAWSAPAGPHIPVGNRTDADAVFLDVDGHVGRELAEIGSWLRRRVPRRTRGRRGEGRRR
jgi:hypothetical protein